MRKNEPVYSNTHCEHIWEHPAISNQRRWLEFGLIHHLRLNKGKGAWGFWAKEASYGKVTRKSTADKGGLVGFVMQI